MEVDRKTTERYVKTLTILGSADFYRKTDTLYRPHYHLQGTYEARSLNTNGNNTRQVRPDKRKIGIHFETVLVTDRFC